MRNRWLIAVAAVPFGLVGASLTATLTLGCDQAAEMAAEVAFRAVEEIQERNAKTAQARIDLEPRPDAKRSEMENAALTIANGELSNGHHVKEAFCGSPPDLSSLPTEYFKFQPSVYIPENTPTECRAAVDLKFPSLASCYLVFDNGSTGYLNCYVGQTSSIECMPVKKLLWEIATNAEFRKDCQKDK